MQFEPHKNLVYLDYYFSLRFKLFFYYKNQRQFRMNIVFVFFVTGLSKNRIIPVLKHVALVTNSMMNHIKEGLLEFSKFYRGPARSETRKPQKRGKRSEMLENTRKPLKHSETKITKTRKL